MQVKDVAGIWASYLWCLITNDYLLPRVLQRRANTTFSTIPQPSWVLSDEQLLLLPPFSCLPKILPCFLQDNSRLGCWQPCCICAQQMFLDICFQTQKEPLKLPRMLTTCQKYLFLHKFYSAHSFQWQLPSIKIYSHSTKMMLKKRKKQKKKKQKKTVGTKSCNEKVKCIKVWKLLNKPRCYWVTAAQWAKLKTSTQTPCHSLTLGISEGQDELKKVDLAISKPVIY